jgi:transposase
LNVSSIQKKELLDFIKKTRNKEEYKRALAVKQKIEGLSYRTIARNIGVNYRNVYRIVDAYRQERLNGIASKRSSAGRTPKISSEKNKQMIKDIVLNRSPSTFGYLKTTWSIRLLAKHLTKELRMNVSPMQTWRIINELGITHKRPKLAIEHDDENDYKERKKVIDNYKRISSALLKKGSPRI